MLRVGVVGATGYAGAETVRLVCGHPEMELVRATSGKEAGTRLDVIYPGLAGACSIELTAPDADDLTSVCDLVFLAVPHTGALALAPQLVGAGVAVVDLSADYRLSDPAVYEAWYAPHTSKELLAQAVYCIPELNRADLQVLARADSRTPRLVANPGCYPTASTLAAAPVLAAGLLREGATVVVDAISGVSGAGKGCTARTHYCMADENLEAYGVGRHRHQPEIAQNFARLASCDVPVIFTPHLAPLKRGLLSTVYLPLVDGVGLEELRGLYEVSYGGERFVHLVPQGTQPRTGNVAGSNRAQVAVVLDERTNTAIATCAIDNLMKGAAGQAVQNANIVCGLDEAMGLDAPAPLI